MTEIEKSTIITMRAKGVGFSAIANELSLPLSTIKSFCRRYKDKCEFCGIEVEQTSGRKHKRFCSDSCRIKWWNLNRTGKEHICTGCGEHFTAIEKRKYCCHKCYIKHRFGGRYEE